jgi:hypothetical protein
MFEFCSVSIALTHNYVRWHKKSFIFFRWNVLQYSVRSLTSLTSLEFWVPCRIKRVLKRDFEVFVNFFSFSSQLKHKKRFLKKSCIWRSKLATFWYKLSLWYKKKIYNKCFFWRKIVQEFVGGSWGLEERKRIFSAFPIFHFLFFKHTTLKKTEV